MCVSQTPLEINILKHMLQSRLGNDSADYIPPEEYARDVFPKLIGAETCPPGVLRYQKLRLRDRPHRAELKRDDNYSRPEIREADLVHEDDKAFTVKIYRFLNKDFIPVRVL